LSIAYLTWTSAVTEERLSAFDVQNECTLFTKIPSVRHREKDAYTAKKNQSMLCRKVVNVYCGKHSKHKIRLTEEGPRFYCWVWRYILTTRLWMVIHHFNTYRWASDSFQVIPCGICGRQCGTGKGFCPNSSVTSISVIPPIPHSFIHHRHYRSYHLTALLNNKFKICLI
jgi:hypothetical protein